MKPNQTKFTDCSGQNFFTGESVSFPSIDSLFDSSSLQQIYVAPICKYFKLELASPHIYICLVSLFNSIEAFVDYLMSNQYF